MPLAEINWTEILSGHGGENVMVLGMFAMLGIVGVTVIVAVFWHKARLVRLKEHMIERGYTAQEIIAVVSAGEENGRAKMTSPLNVPSAGIRQSTGTTAN